MDKGEQKPSSGLELETERSLWMTSVLWVMLTHSSRTAALGQAVFAQGSCQETTVTHSSPSQRQTHQTITRLQREWRWDSNEGGDG